MVLMPEKNNPVRSNILFDFYEYVSLRWAFIPFKMKRGSSSFRGPKFEILYHIILSCTPKVSYIFAK